MDGWLFYCKGLVLKVYRPVVSNGKVVDERSDFYQRGELKVLDFLALASDLHKTLIIFQFM